MQQVGGAPGCMYIMCSELEGGEAAQCSRRHTEVVIVHNANVYYRGTSENVALRR